MGSDRPDNTTRQARRSQTHGRRTRGSQRDFLRAGDGLPMEGFAQRPAAQEYGAFLLHVVGLERDAGAYSRLTLCRPTRIRRQGSEPDDGDYRQPERQGCSKRGATIDPQGFDAGKKVTGRKRHILVDTLGLLLGVGVLPANIQDRDGARALLQSARRRFPFIAKIFADAGYQGPKMARTIAATGCWKIEIVKRSDAKGFLVLPKRWIVERTLAWISRNRRLMRDFERYATTVAAFVRLAMIRLMLKRLTCISPCL